MSALENFPAYFARIPGLSLYDPLAALLGAPSDGRLHYTFADAVRVAGHACPTVAGAWLATTRALRALYPEDTPQRGQVQVSLAASIEHGAEGVIGQIAGWLTGAAGAGGFAGLAGQHRRRNLLQFGVAGAAQLSFTRLDQRQRIDCWLDLRQVPADPQLPGLLQHLLNPEASGPDLQCQQRFAALWQQRVEQILLASDEYPGLLRLQSGHVR